MRVTNNITTRQYLTNNNRELTQMLKSENRISTQRRFNRVSEDPVNGSKAMILRRQLRNLKIYNENLSTAKALFSAAETNLTSIAHDEYITVEEKLTAAANGSWSQQELDIFATELDEIAEQMVTTMNHDFSERELFGGTSNGRTPFRIERVRIEDENGTVVFPPDYDKYYNTDGSMKEGLTLIDIPRTVTYNGVPLDFDVTSDMILPDGSFMGPDDSKSYKVYVLDDEKKVWKDEVQDIKNADVKKAIEEKDNSMLYPGSKPIYVDIGLGIKYNDKYEVDPQTALDISMNGAKITGNGLDVSTVGASYGCTGTVPAATDTALKDGFAAAPASGYSIEINGQALALDPSPYLPSPHYTEAQVAAAVKEAVIAADTSVNYPADTEVTYNGSTGDFTFSSASDPTFASYPSITIMGLRNGEAGGTTHNVTINGNTVAIDVSGKLPKYTDSEISAALTKALADAVKNSGNKDVPSDISVNYSNGNISLSSGTAIKIGTNDLGIAAGDSVKKVNTDDDGNMILDDRFSKNLMQLVLDAAVACRRGRQDTVNAIIDRANDANNKILTEITTLGAKQNSIDFYVEKNRDYEFDLKERQNLVEGTDMEEEIIRYEAIKAAYDATLKMGADILPHSIFDFIS